MSRRPPATLAELRDLSEEARAEASEALGELLVTQHEHGRCLRVILKMVKHLHSKDAKRTPTRK